MPRLALATMFAALVVGPRAASAQLDTLRYSLTYHASNGGAPTLDVDVVFRGDRSGRTRVVVPTTWAGETDLGRALGDIELGAGVTPGPVQGDERTLIHRPGAVVRLHYVLHQDWTGPLRYPLFHRVILDGSRVAFNQSTALVYPEHVPGSKVVLQVQWSGLPDDWRIVSSFGSKAWISTLISWREFSAAFFAAGAFRLVAAPSATGGVTIAAQGHWPFTDAEFTQMVGSLWSAETAFWNGAAFDRAFVLLLPIDNAGTVAGTAFTAGFFAVADTAADLKPLGRLLAHELFHLWSGQRMTAALDEVRYKWFTEGVTDYYADRIFRGIGQYSDSEYRDRVNAVLKRYYSSPARGSSRDVIAQRYWASDDFQQYPYAQGYVFASFLQTNLPLWSASAFDLDSLMRRAYLATALRGLDVSDSLLLQQAPASARAAMADALSRYIDRGGMIPPDSAALGRCTSVRTEPVYNFDLGFDADASRATRIVTGVRPDGPAAAAGIVNGMRLAGWSWDGTASTRVILQIEDGRGVRLVTYLPHGREMFLVPQYEPTPRVPGCLTLGM